MYAIAIDGPSASGKSSVADKVAKKLNILHLNTGCLYRALGLYAYKNKLAQTVGENGLPVITAHDISEMTKTDVSVKFEDGKQHTLLNGEDVSDFLRTPAVTDFSSRVSVIPEIRDHVLNLQRNIAKQHNIVMEGRDITSHVLPDAKYKFFITASPEVRAERRLIEMQNEGLLDTYEDVLVSIKERDYRDENRDCCPLVLVPDAVKIDTSNMTLDQVVDTVLSYIKE